MSNKETQLQSPAVGLAPGRIPFWLRQKSLVTLSGHTLRPGGIMLTQRAADFCDFPADARILDAGCGYGMTLGYLKDTYGTGCIGLDHDRRVLNRARHRFKSQPDFPLLQAGLSSIPFRSDHFNGIFCECALSLVKNRAACLAELYRVMARNGQVVITDLYIRKWKIAPDPVSSETNPPSCLAGAVTLFEMMTAIEHAGFKIDIIEDHTSLLSQLGTPQVRSEKTGYCMIVAGKYE